MLTSPSRASTADRKFSGSYTSNPRGGRSGLFLHVALPCNLALNSSTQSILHLIIGTCALERYMTCCRKSEYITFRNSACRNNAMYPMQRASELDRTFFGCLPLAGDQAYVRIGMIWRQILISAFRHGRSTREARKRSIGGHGGQRGVKDLLPSCKPARSLD
jgi:hypothetical protein